MNFVFDPQFQDQTITLDLRDVPFEQALTALGSVGRTFHRVRGLPRRHGGPRHARPSAASTSSRW